MRQRRVLLLLMLCLAWPALPALARQQTAAGRVQITIPPIARITSVQNRELARSDGRVSVRYTVTVRANTPYRVSLALESDAGEDVVVQVETGAGQQQLSGDRQMLVAAAHRLPVEQLHTVIVHVPEELYTDEEEPPLVFQVSGG